jgi:hypothetical protein
LFCSFRAQGHEFEAIRNFLETILYRDACHNCPQIQFVSRFLYNNYE